MIKVTLTNEILNYITEIDKNRYEAASVEQLIVTDEENYPRTGIKITEISLNYLGLCFCDNLYIIQNLITKEENKYGKRSESIPFKNK